ncbi:PilZ domain-containing protein [Trichloromonas sp.]|uniref:PilZ domain-containing protein n=1 Tax=Trichloromonas sp. TaxID=3069249 RepID=UPI003D813738
MAEKRDDTRHRKRLKVRYGDKDHMKIGFTEDVSEEGMFIRTGLTKTPKATLYIELETSPDETVALSGQVQWSKRVPPSMAHKLKGGMGVKISDFTSGEEAFRKLLAFLKETR